MVAKKILEQKPITNTEASEYLVEIEAEYTKKEKELPFEIQQTKEYLSKINKDNKKDMKIKLEKLKELNIPEIACVELVNINSKNDEIIKTILFKKVDFTDDLVKQIKEIIA